MFGNSAEAIDDLFVLIESARIEVGAQLQMNGFVLTDDSTMVPTYGLDELDLKRWIKIVSAERRLTNALTTMGPALVTEYDDLLAAFHNQFCVSPGPADLQ